MKISVVVPTLNSQNDITRLLKSITNNDISKDIELIVVDANSTDATISIVEQYKFAKVVHAGLCSKGKARNEGVQNSSNNIIANIDADTEILPGWSTAILSSLKHSDIVAGYSPNPNKNNLPRVPIIVDGQDITWPCCNIAHKRSVFNSVGLFHDSFTMSAEDCDFNFRCIKQGYIITYNPNMKLYHHQRTSFTKFCKQSYWNGYYRKGLQKLHPELSLSNMHNLQFKNLFRLSFGALGYLTGDWRTKKGEKHS